VQYLTKREKSIHSFMTSGCEKDKLQTLSSQLTTITDGILIQVGRMSHYQMYSKWPAEQLVLHPVMWKKGSCGLLHITRSNTVIYAVLKAWLCRPYAVLLTEKFFYTDYYRTMLIIRVKLYSRRSNIKQTAWSEVSRDLRNDVTVLRVDLSQGAKLSTTLKHSVEVAIV